MLVLVGAKLSNDHKEVAKHKVVSTRHMTALWLS